jgi:hypothetical protein
MLTLVYSYSVSTRTAEQTSLPFDEPHFLLTCESPFFISLPFADRGRVSVSHWQKLVSMDSAGKSHFATWYPVELRSSERSIKHHAYPIGL